MLYHIVVLVAESSKLDLGKVIQSCDLYGMKLNASKTKTIIVSRSPAIHPRSPPLTIGGTVQKESYDLDLLVLIFDSKIPSVAKHLRSVSRETFQRLASLKNSWRVFYDRLLLGRCFRGFVLPVLKYVLQCDARLPIHTLNYWTVYIRGACF